MIMISMALLIPLFLGSIAYYFAIVRYSQAGARKEKRRDENFLRTIHSDIFNAQML